MGILKRDSATLFAFLPTANDTQQEIEFAHGWRIIHVQVFSKGFRYENIPPSKIQLRLQI